jgi:hypothetical protein
VKIDRALYSGTINNFQDYRVGVPFLLDGCGGLTIENFVTQYTDNGFEVFDTGGWSVTALNSNGDETPPNPGPATEWVGRFRTGGGGGGDRNRIKICGKFNYGILTNTVFSLNGNNFDITANPGTGAWGHVNDATSASSIYATMGKGTVSECTLKNGIDYYVGPTRVWGWSDTSHPSASMTESEITKAITDLQNSKGNIVEAYHKSSFVCFRHSKSGLQKVAVDIFDAGTSPKLNPKLRYRCEVKREDGLLVSSAEEATIKEALARLPWDKLDAPSK